jgi:hypothetical protein
MSGVLKHSIPFSAADARASLAQLPQSPAVFALFGADPTAEPYLNKTPNLRRRLTRFLDARPEQTKRLQLAAKVVRIEWTLTGSDFESQLLLYKASREAFGEAANKRMKLRAPAFLRMAKKNPYPRVYATNTVTISAADSLYGPFPGRLAAERFCDEALNLFLLRRCYEELHPDPAFPGCAYGEMKMCLAPCNQGCTDERYAEEAKRVAEFLETRGESLAADLARDREAASEALRFEKAAAVHDRIRKVEAVMALASDTVRPLSRLNGLVLQPAALQPEGEHVALFLLRRGILAGPALYSVAGIRHPNEQSGSSSLFAHPTALQPVPLGEGHTTAVVAMPAMASRDLLEQRLDEALASLEQQWRDESKGLGKRDALAAHLCLYARWYYRPTTKRVGEVYFEAADGSLPKKAILRGISRVFRSDSSNAAKDAETVPPPLL